MSRKSKRKAMRSGVRDCHVCGNKRRLVEHHINGRDIPNCNMSWNLCWVCDNCHSDIHAGDVILEGWVSTTSGKELSFYRKGEQKPNLRHDADVYIY